MVNYLKCDVSEGMLSSEKGVEFHDINGKLISGFFPNKLIKENNLEIQVINSWKDKSLIRAKFPDSGGYGFFQGSGFYVNNNLISESE